MMRRSQRGTTLIELMVALAIGLILSLVLFALLSVFEGRRRTVNSGGDLDQAGTVAMFQIDRWVRSAGSGFVQGSAYTYGCELFAAKGGSQILPTGSLPAPFDTDKLNPGTPGAFRLAPVLIIPGGTSPGVSVSGQSTATSDVLVVMSTGNQSGDVPALLTATPTVGAVPVSNTLPFASGDLALLVDRQPAASGGIAPCLVTQAADGSGGANTSMSLSGAYYSASVGTQGMTAYSSTAAILDLGNTSTLQPSFQLIGVGANNTLYTYDLLQVAATPLQMQAENVFEMHALYGVDTDGDNKIDSWVKADSGNYTVAKLGDGSQSAAALLKSIRAIRVGLILRTSLPEKDKVATVTTLRLFRDLGTPLTFTRSLAAGEQYYRYRTIEQTIPVRNNQY